MYVVGDGNCMKEIPFLTLQRDIFDPLPPKYQPLFKGCWRRCIDRSTTNSSILHWRKKQRKKTFPSLAHHVTVVFHFFHICCLFLFYCLSNGVKSKAWCTMNYDLLKSKISILVKINGFWSYKNIFKQFEQKKMCKKIFSHRRK